MATTGLLLNHGTAQHAPVPKSAGVRVATLYVPLILVQAGLLFYVARVGRERSALRALVGMLWPSGRRAAGDVTLALAGWLGILAFERACAPFAGGARDGASALAVLPHSALERLAWVLVSLSVGFGEEVVYRGYLQTQLRAFTQSPAAAILLQAFLFAVAHLDQGLAAAARLAVYGAGLGTMAHLRRSLVPGILCHAWTDLASGLFFG